MYHETQQKNQTNKQNRTTTVSITCTSCRVCSVILRVLRFLPVPVVKFSLKRTKYKVKLIAIPKGKLKF